MSDMSVAKLGSQRSHGDVQNDIGMEEETSLSVSFSGFS